MPYSPILGNLEVAFIPACIEILSDIAVNEYRIGRVRFFYRFHQRPPADESELIRLHRLLYRHAEIRRQRRILLYQVHLLLPGIRREGQRQTRQKNHYLNYMPHNYSGKMI